MLHPWTELRFLTPEVGYGIIATRPIPAGTIIWAPDELDRFIPETQLTHYSGSTRALIERYSYRNRHGDYVLCWDLGRYINHSCNANCLSPGLELEIAVQDIPAGSELTDDYGSIYGVTIPECRCGASDCRGQVLAGDFERMAAAWDARIKAAIPEVTRVPQPLWNVVSVDERALLSDAAANPDITPSITRNRTAVPSRELPRDDWRLRKDLISLR
jgi:hypothetical protein